MGLLNFGLFIWIIINNIRHMEDLWKLYPLSFFVMIIVDFLLIYNTYIWIRWYMKDSYETRENLSISVYILVLFTILNIFVWLLVPWSLLFVWFELNDGVRIITGLADGIFSFAWCYYFLSMVKYYEEWKKYH